MAVLVATDVDQAPDRPISVGYDLATAYDDTMVALYVMSDDEFRDRQGGRDSLPEEFEEQEFTLERALDDAANRAANAVDVALDTYERKRVETRGRVGSPEEEILGEAEEIDPRYIAVGDRNRSPQAGYLRERLAGDHAKSEPARSDAPGGGRLNRQYEASDERPR